MAQRKASSRHKRAPRPTCAVERGTGCQLGGYDVQENTLNRLRVQRLIARGFAPSIANAMAPMVWGATV